MSGSPDREIMTIEEAAELLGVSVKTFNKVLHSQSIPARKIGREWKFSRQALIDWIGSGRSDEFYRESDQQNGRKKAATTVRPPRKARRTSGWRLELD
jgi:excisionase family DNA binding protein